MPKTVTDEIKPVVLTKWEAFEKAGLKPVSMECLSYRPHFNVDMSCHTKLPINAQTILSHVRAEHGGGFQFKLARTEGKPSPLWKELAEAQLEAADVRCEVCDKDLPLNPQVLLKHLFQAHSGVMRRSRTSNLLNITFTENRPIPKDDDYDFDPSE